MADENASASNAGTDSAKPPQLDEAVSELLPADAGATRDDVVQNGGVGYAAAYALLTSTTQWLGVLPPIPDGLGEPLTLALASLIGCGLYHFRRALGIRKAAKQMEG